MVSLNLTIVLFGVKPEAKYRDVAPLRGLPKSALLIACVAISVGHRNLATQTTYSVSGSLNCVFFFCLEFKILSAHILFLGGGRGGRGDSVRIVV